MYFGNKSVHILNFRNVLWGFYKNYVYFLHPSDPVNKTSLLCIYIQGGVYRSSTCKSMKEGKNF